MTAPRAGIAALGTLSFFVSAASAQNPTLSALATSFIAPVRAATTLGAWRLTHPTDNITRSWEGNGFVQCASAYSHRVIAVGDTAEVRVLFYVPALPSSKGLPVGETPDQVLDRCEAGMVRITIYDTAAARITMIHRAFQQDLAAASLFGDAVLPWMHSQPGNMDGNSRHDDSIAVASVRFMGGRQGETTSPWSEVTVQVAARRAHEHPELPGWDQGPLFVGDSESRQKDARLAAKEWLAMFAGAGMGGGLEHEIRVTLTQLDLVEVPTHTMIGLLQRWLTAAKPLPSARRAAALMIADSLMMRWNPYFDATAAGDSLHDRLVSIGVPISLMRGYKDESYYGFRRDWAMQAYQIAPTSRAGEYAFLQVIANQGICSSDHSAMIALSESYLQRYPRTRIGAQLHTFLGGAWADEVMGDSVDVDGVFDPSIASSRPQAGFARQRAIAHFQAAFRLNVDPARTWNDAFRVWAGLPPIVGGDCE